MIRTQIVPAPPYHHVQRLYGSRYGTRLPQNTYMHLQHVQFNSQIKYNTIDSTTVQQGDPHHIWLCQPNRQQFLLEELALQFPTVHHYINQYANCVYSHGTLHTEHSTDVPVVAFSHQLLYNIQPINTFNNTVAQKQRIVWNDVFNEIMLYINNAFQSDDITTVSQLYLHLIPTIHFTGHTQLRAHTHAHSRSVYRTQLDSLDILHHLQQYMAHNNHPLHTIIHTDPYTQIQHLYTDTQSTHHVTPFNNVRVKLRQQRTAQRAVREGSTVDILLGKLNYDIDLCGTIQRCIVQISILPDISMYISIITPEQYKYLYKSVSRFPAGLIVAPKYTDTCQLSSPPSTAYGKAIEAEIRGGKYVITTHRTNHDTTLSGYDVLDVGACPGGFTWIYLQRGLHVHAIDTASQLSNHLMKHSNLLYQQQSAFQFVPECFQQSHNNNTQFAYGTLCSDILCRPEQIIELMHQWLVLWPLQYNRFIAQRFIIVVKFMGTSEYQSTLIGIQQLFRQQHHITYNIKHLHANKNEFTVYGYMNAAHINTTTESIT